jgi:hypothetical protein
MYIKIMEYCITEKIKIKKSKMPRKKKKEEKKKTIEISKALLDTIKKHTV